MAKFQAPKGVSEYFPHRSTYFEYVRSTIIESVKVAGYQLMELPVFEDTELFARGVGESTDVVRKEMYTFEDRGGRSITLRPEGTAGVIRAIIEHNLDRGQLPVKVFYSGAFFRAERPQAGRYRQFYQVGIEAVGVLDPRIDVEVIAAAHRALNQLGLKKYHLEITTLGDTPSREKYVKELRTYIESISLDAETSERSRLNPLRLFDDKRPEVKGLMAQAPVLMDYLTIESKNEFEKVKNLLTALSIPFKVNNRMVRGLDYYTGIAFEFVHPDLGAQSGIGGGGRYDGLMAQLGGQDLSGIGFGLGVDRILLACEAEGIDLPTNLGLDLFIVPLGEGDTAFFLAEELRARGIHVDIAFGERGLKGGMKSADRSGAKYSLVLGADEISSGVAFLKEMKSGESTSVTLGTLANELIELLVGHGEHS